MFGLAVSADLAEVSALGEGYLAVAALRAWARGREQSSSPFSIGRRRGGAARIMPARVAASYRDGVPMEPKDLQDLYDLEIRTWAPTSERSRSQAGYGKF